MPCYFCDLNIKLLPGFSGEQYHVYVPNIGYPRCAFAFDDKDKPHPFLPDLNFPMWKHCAFCFRLPEDVIHKIKDPQ